MKKLYDIIVLKNNIPQCITGIPQWLVSLVRITYLLLLCGLICWTIYLFKIKLNLFGLIFIFVTIDYIQPLFGRSGMQGLAHID